MRLGFWPGVVVGVGAAWLYHQWKPLPRRQSGS